MSLERVPAHIKDRIAEPAKKVITFNSDGVGLLAEDHFEKTLPEGLTLEVGKQWQSAEQDYVDGVFLAFGEASAEHLKKNPDLAGTTLSLTMGHNGAALSYDRQTTVRNPQTKQEMQKYGATNCKFTTNAGARRGNFKRIQEHLSAQATTLFSS